MSNYLTGKAKAKRIDIKAVLGPRVGLKFLGGKMDRGILFLPEKHWADHQQRNTSICLEIFSQLDMSCWKVHTLSVSMQKLTWCMSVRPAASESPGGFVIQLQY